MLTIFVIPQTTIGQCSVTKEDVNEAVVLSAKSEQLYKNEDLENGLQTVYSNCMLVVDKTDKDKVKFSIIVTYFKTSHKPTIVPRSLTFAFSNGQSLTCQADEYDTPYLSGIKGERCFFRVSVSDMNKIKDSALKAFVISDNRTGENLRMTPFSSIFQEQIECILKKYDEL
jgi:hypothetical protein